MNTDNIKIIFGDYLKADKTQYAILLNGKWGSGKTYFWKHYLQDIATQDGFKVIYISLNGISKIDALDHLLFIKLLPYINNQENSALKNITTIVTNGINQVTKHFLKASLTDIFKGVSVDAFHFTKYVICFDDLERCQIPVKEVLGFINNYVEHKSLKTIILADETNIDASQRGTGYDNIKEKVIGRVLNFELNIVETLPELFKKYEKDKIDFYNFLLKQKQILVDILTEYKQDNLRVISFYLDSLEKIFPSFTNVEEKYIQELILFTAIISIDFKKGNLKSSDYKTPQSIDIIDENYYSLYIAGTIRESQKEKDEKERVKSFAELFYERYLDTRIKDYFFYQSIYSYILSGYINILELDAEIKKRYPEILSQEIKDFRALLDYKFRQLSDSDFKNISESVLKFAKEGKYSIYDYIQIANFYYFFSDSKLIPQSVEDINNVLIQGLNIAKKRKQINDRVLENLMHFGDKNPEVTKMKNIVKQIHLEIKKEEYVMESSELIDCLTTKDEYELAAIFEKQKFSKELFQYLDDQLLFDTVLKISNKQLFNFTELLNHRFEISNIGEFLYEDLTCLTKLNENLTEYLNKNPDIQQPRKFLYSSLETILQVACVHLEQTKKT